MQRRDFLKALGAGTLAAAGSSLPRIGHAAGMVPVRLQLKWFPQAQFAGYFVAKGKGFYAAEGLDVTLLPIGEQSPIQTVVAGAADFGTTWITDLLTASSRGLPVVEIAQIFQKSGFTLTTLKKYGIEKPADFKGHTVGIWPGGNAYPALAFFKKYGLTTSLEPGVGNPDVKLVTYGFDPKLVFPDKAQVVSAMIYNEVDQIINMGYPLDTLKIFDLADYGINLLEDNMFTTQNVLNEGNFKGSGISGKEVGARLLRASLKGWDWAVKHQAEAVSMVLSQCGPYCKGAGKAASGLKHQTWMMAHIAQLYEAGPTLKGDAGLLEKSELDNNIALLNSLKVLKTQPAKNVAEWSVWEMATGKRVPWKV
ncbi:ABC transporter substrate-binding protein [Acidihalobacter ferrooxydans]|uniref:Thiamine pyrimidine synthase n=1 Tax=Acidihalobacter ferrooxydans TaxID=1765967 RepID=A0A1P8UGM3_9GAMM|nr:ABC transporter substrate-binding protein [Acidihalobacter ferrooxydans]APZ42931.1 myristoyl transferase [Acidihalobacter ferrooxydans]